MCDKFLARVDFQISSLPVDRCEQVQIIWAMSTYKLIKVKIKTNQITRFSSKKLKINKSINSDNFVTISKIKFLYLSFNLYFKYTS